MNKKDPIAELEKITLKKNEIVAEIKRKRKKFTKTLFAKLRQIAMNYAKQRFARDLQLREDFAQEYCLAVWQGKTDRLDYQYANFYRKYFGRNDKYATEDEKAKSLALKNTMSYKEE
jgi:hypothetical protein